MLKDLNFEKIINSIVSNINSEWNYLIVKMNFTKRSFTAKYYYSKDGIEYSDLDKDNVEIFDLIEQIMEELDPFTDKNFSNDELMFITIKATKEGNVKVIYKDVKNGNKILYDEEMAYGKLNDSDKEF